MCIYMHTYYVSAGLTFIREQPRLAVNHLYHSYHPKTTGKLVNTSHTPQVVVERQGMESGVQMYKLHFSVDLKDNEMWFHSH